ncbi:type II toxin-antitoxin system HicA family toxin [Synechococcus sp. GFB01]|uniref:type II toxin-antitoxin system HicA family toxin n=1 Tax=Synechococcus sp. GFB01 TaxID=1662190 RepID=UPI001F22D057|nr:type II toxin-antitoxin system HicA family toxin [Synechococcus sp. GFB01]
MLAALVSIGWCIKRQTGSHRVLAREGFADVVFAFHDSEEIGPTDGIQDRQNTHRPASPPTVSPGPFLLIETAGRWVIEQPFRRP